MAAINKKVKPESKFDADVKLAGGAGISAAKQDNVGLLRRSVLACLLWEDQHYESGESVAANIAKLVPLVEPSVVADIAIEARKVQKLRHVPLFIANEMTKHAEHNKHVARVLENVATRPDQLSEFLALHWNGVLKHTGKKSPISNQAKLGLAKAFSRFDEYQLAKWNKNNGIRLRDVLCLVHPKPRDEAQSVLWKKLLEGKLATPDTWEVRLSAAKGVNEKRQVWVDLIDGNKLGALALLRNLRNMQQVNVPSQTIIKALESAKPDMLLPINFISAATHAPDYMRHIENLMFKCAAQFEKLRGRTIFVVDVSGSMGSPISGKSDFTRLSVATSMAVLAAEMCENVVIYATAGSDGNGTHKTVKVKNYRGFALADAIAKDRLGGGGIFTRQCLEYIKLVETEKADRIIVFSDSQDMDRHDVVPKPFGKRNYIVDVASGSRGINYKGVWTAEISGWSEGFLRYIAEMEKTDN